MRFNNKGDIRPSYDSKPSKNTDYTLMLIKGPILIIDDDEDDRELCRDAVLAQELLNEIRIFRDGSEALDYLTSTGENPYIILCDIRMPRMSGLELREQVVNSPLLRRKSIPFIFITGSADSHDVDKAYELSVQGFFVKPNSIERWGTMMRKIFNYWGMCQEPNSKDL